jgi:hypothetical protein
VKAMLLNEAMKHPLFKTRFVIGRSFDSFKKIQYPYCLIITTFHDLHVIKVAPNKQM